MTTAGLSAHPKPVSLRRRLRPIARWAPALLALANGAIVVSLWWRAGGVREIDDTASALTGIGRLSGLLGAYLVLVQVLLLARIPVLDRTFGFDRLTVWHRRNGKLALSLLLVHAAAITTGYAVGDGVSLSSEIGRLLSGYPGVITAARRARHARRDRRQLARDRAPAAALRDVVLRAPLHLPRDRAGLQPPDRDRAGVRRRPDRARLLAGALRRDARRGRGVPARRSGVAQRPPPPARRAGDRGGAGRGVAGDRRRAARGTQGACGPVLLVAVPDPRALVAVAPVLALRRPRRPAAADHGQGGGRLQRGLRRSGPARAWSSTARTARSPRRRGGGRGSR